MPITSQSNYLFDVEPLVTLRNGNDAPETATASEAPVSLQAQGGAYWQNDEQTFRYAAVVFNVQNTLPTAGGETYALSVEVAQDAAFTLGVATVGTVASVTAPGYYTVTLNGDTIDALSPGAKYIRVTATLAGTAPVIDYAAFIAPVVGAH